MADGFHTKTTKKMKKKKEEEEKKEDKDEDKDEVALGAHGRCEMECDLHSWLMSALHLRLINEADHQQLLTSLQ